MTGTNWRFPALFVLGALFLQLSWCLSLPAFTGVDEFDHAYRAAAVAGGEWRSHLSSPPGVHGSLVTVPESLPPAASPICSWMPYTKSYNCSAVNHLDNAMVTVSSGAADYNPAYYWVIGTVALAAKGIPSLYLMRLASSILCLGMLLLAGWSVSLWARTVWPKVALLVSLTPVAVYSLVVAAPNGLEFCAALALWSALLGVVRAQRTPDVQRRLIWACLPSGLVLTTVRTLGPLWLALTVLTVVAVHGISRTRLVIAAQRQAIAWVSALLTCGSLASVWWILSARTNQPGQEQGLSNPVGSSLKQIPLWIFQGVGAFPTRGEPAPSLVYAVALPMIVCFCVIGWRAADQRARKVMMLVATLSVLVPLAFSVAVYSSIGAVWQGRYGLPLTIGVFALIGIALEDSQRVWRFERISLLLGFLALATAQTVSVVSVLKKESAFNPFAGTSHWMMPQLWMVAALAVLGCLCWGAAVLTDAGTSSPPLVPTDSFRSQRGSRAPAAVQR